MSVLFIHTYVVHSNEVLKSSFQLWMQYYLNGTAVISALVTTNAVVCGPQLARSDYYYVQV